MKRRDCIKLATGLAASTLITGFIKPKETSCPDTPILEYGPFAVMQYRKQADHDIDLTNIRGNKEIAKGEIIFVKGKILNKDCSPLQHAIVEIWQANHFGKYKHENDDKGESDMNFQGWGQAVTNDKGEYRFKTIVPGLYGNRARHIHFKVSKRGYHEMTTQLYFDGEERNKTDGILNQFTHEEQLLITKSYSITGNEKQIEFNIVLEKVLKNTVPEKVIKEYTGRYELQVETSNLNIYLKKTINKDSKNIFVEFTHNNNQLFIDIPNNPRIELGWNAKDEFQSWAFYNSFIRFKRNDVGKVIELQLHFGEDYFVLGIKQ